MCQKKRRSERVGWLTQQCWQHLFWPRDSINDRIHVFWWLHECENVASEVLWWRADFTRLCQTNWSLQVKICLIPMATCVQISSQISDMPAEMTFRWTRWSVAYVSLIWLITKPRTWVTPLVFPPSLLLVLNAVCVLC